MNFNYKSLIEVVIITVKNKAEILAMAHYFTYQN
jgi:hypothetical protein